MRTTAAFYAALLGSGSVSKWPDGALFAVGDVNVLLHERRPRQPEGPPNEDYVAFSVPDLDAACADLCAMDVEVLLEERVSECGRSAYVRNPDGRLAKLSL